MKKLLPWSAASILAFGVVLWTVAQMTPARADIQSLFPDNALLYIEAKNFGGLLNDWNSSQEKRAWLRGDDYAAFSRSRLFERLSQAQSEFSAAASIPTDPGLLSSVAGTESALAIYDIGNLQFVYVSRLPQAKIEATPLWQVRDKFEQRAEGSAQFYVHVDRESSRTAAFAARDGWLILATRDDLVADVLDRLQGAHPHGLPDEPWYADSLKQASGPAGDLRMVLNLEKLVPSPYFRSYWVQRNITEMKQYRAALCDLRRGSDAYREDRVLLREPGLNSSVSGDVNPLLALAPEDAVFSSAQASPDHDRVLAMVRENLLEVKPVQQQASWSAAPAQVNIENAGSASMLEERIDVAPVIAAHSDADQPLRTLLAAAQPSAALEVYATHSAKDDMFVGIYRAVVLVSPSRWNEPALQSAISAALRPGLTASQLGIEWTQHSAANGTYSSLTGEVPLYMALRGNQLFLADRESLLVVLLSRQKLPPSSPSSPITHGAVFQHTPREQQSFRSLVDRLDAAGHSPTNPDAGAADGQSPPFMSGNIASLSRMFTNIDRETIDERDQGAVVTQTVFYNWRHR